MWNANEKPHPFQAGLECNIFVSLLPINHSTPEQWLALLKESCFCKDGWYKSLQ
jgi:hypothetical protein